MAIDQLLDKIWIYTGIPINFCSFALVLAWAALWDDNIKAFPCPYDAEDNGALHCYQSPWVIL